MIYIYIYIYNIYIYIGFTRYLLTYGGSPCASERATAGSHGQHSRALSSSYSYYSYSCSYYDSYCAVPPPLCSPMVEASTPASDPRPNVTASIVDHLLIIIIHIISSSSIRIRIHIHIIQCPPPLLTYGGSQYAGE